LLIVNYDELVFFAKKKLEKKKKKKRVMACCHSFFCNKTTIEGDDLLPSPSL